jgi:F0F1-type ATP synthase alpha subunit
VGKTVFIMKAVAVDAILNQVDGLAVGQKTSTVAEMISSLASPRHEFIRIHNDMPQTCIP